MAVSFLGEGLCVSHARAEGLELPVVEAVARQFERTVDLGHGDEDMAAVVLALTH